MYKDKLLIRVWAKGCKEHQDDETVSINDFIRHIKNWQNQGFDMINIAVYDKRITFNAFTIREETKAEKDKRLIEEKQKEEKAKVDRKAQYLLLKLEFGNVN